MLMINEMTTANAHDIPLLGHSLTDNIHPNLFIACDNCFYDNFESSALSYLHYNHRSLSYIFKYPPIKSLVHKERNYTEF